MSNEFDIKQSNIGFLRAQYLAIASGIKLLGSNSLIYRGPTLVHYTNLTGMINILESGSFWLSDIRFLNDADEFDNGCRLARELIKTLINRPRNEHFVEVLKISLDLLDQPPQEPHYVASFSQDSDNLELWRAYAAGTDGVALVFDNEYPAKELTHFVVLPILHPTIAIYDDSLKKRVLLTKISRFAIEYRKDIYADKKTFTSHSDVDIWAHHLVRTLYLNFVAFKHAAFKNENEIRLIVNPRQAMSFSDIKHRVFSGRVVPYLSSSILYDEAFIKANNSRRLPLREVVVGPIAKQAVTIESIKVFLANAGYMNVSVRPSNVPFRG